VVKAEKIKVSQDIPAYAIVIDPATRIVRIAYLRRYAGQLFYLPEGWGGPKYLFVPSAPPVGTLGTTGKPVYLALQFSRTAVAIPVELPLVLNVEGEEYDLSSPQGVEKLIQVIGEKLLREEQRLGELQLFEGVSVAVPVRKALVALSSWIASAVRATYDGLTDYWQEIEKASAVIAGRRAETFRGIAMLVILGAALAIVFLILMRLRLFFVFPALPLPAELLKPGWLKWLRNLLRSRR
jgi:hypothetical protein